MKKVALVTGSTKGIGKAIAQKLQDEGAEVVINSNSEIVSVDDNFFEESHYFQANIAEKKDLLAMADHVKQKYGRLDYLVANAGVMPLPCGISNITDEVMDQTINVNLKGTFWTLKIFGELPADLQ